MLHFQRSSGGDTTDCGEAKTQSGDPTAQCSATGHCPSVHLVISATEHITPLTASYRAQIEHHVAPQAGSTKGVVGTSRVACLGDNPESSA